MRISKLFTIPEGEKVTEQKLRSVLVASICSILLCMTCLASTTWAWFTVSVENTGNVIVPYWPEGAAWFSNGVEVSPGVTLTKGENVFIINHRSAADDLGRKCDLYVTFSVDSMAQNYIKLCKENNYSTAVTLIVSDDSGTHKVFWGVSRSDPTPDGITVNDSGTVKITVEEAENTRTESGEGATGGDNAGTESGKGTTGGDNAGTGSGEGTTGGDNAGTESGEDTTGGGNTGTESGEGATGGGNTGTESGKDTTSGDNTGTDENKPTGDDTTGNGNSNNEQGGNENGNSSSQTTTEPEVTPETQEPTEEEPSGEA